MLLKRELMSRVTCVGKTTLMSKHAPWVECYEKRSNCRARFICSVVLDQVLKERQKEHISLLVKEKRERESERARARDFPLLFVLQLSHSLPKVRLHI